MSIKIFVPFGLFYCKEDCDIYGEIKINDTNNSIAYFIRAYTPKHGHAQSKYNNLRHLGDVIRAGPDANRRRRDSALSFTYDADTPNIYISKMNIKPPQNSQANVFLYDADRILQLQVPDQRSSHASGGDADADEASEECDDIPMLYHLLQDRQINKKTKRYTVMGILSFILNFPLDVMTRLFILFMELKSIEWALRHSVLYEHYVEWKKFRATGKRNINITVDRILGICVMLLLLQSISHPGDYLLHASNFIIGKLRLLLHSLKGSPIGLKLNVQLNNFFLDCFAYHIDLWGTFLVMIQPFIGHLFVPIALLGSMGLSYQLALLADIISVIGLHAHCFYIYAAVLYKVEIKGLQVLWKVVLGKRRNVLKNRIESHNYMNRQLYLATIFFATLLFLFPTILVYYTVFTSLRLCICLVNVLLQMKRRRILEFPLEALCKWFMGNFYEIEGIQLQYIDHTPSPPLLQTDNAHMDMSVFKLNVVSSSLSRVFSCESGVLKELKSSGDDQKSMGNIFKRILKGTF